MLTGTQKAVLAAIVKPAGVAWHPCDGGLIARGRSVLDDATFDSLLIGACVQYVTRESAAQLGWSDDEGVWDFALLDLRKPAKDEQYRWHVARDDDVLQCLATLILGMEPNHDERAEQTDRRGVDGNEGLFHEVGAG